jgi:hypothetical protein
MIASNHPPPRQVAAFTAASALTSASRVKRALLLGDYEVMVFSVRKSFQVIAILMMGFARV